MASGRCDPSMAVATEAIDRGGVEKGGWKAKSEREGERGGTGGERRKEWLRILRRAHDVETEKGGEWKRSRILDRPSFEKRARLDGEKMSVRGKERE